MGLSNWQIAVTQTDTVWGIVAKLDSAKNADRIYEIKARDRSKPLILFGRDLEALRPFVQTWDSRIEKLAKQHWPGALTIITKRSNTLPDWVNPREEYIGLRVANSASVMRLFDSMINDVSSTNEVLLSTSANLSGEAPVNNYQEALDQFSGQVDIILEPSPCESLSNSASTIIKVTDSEILILRQGEIYI